MVDTNGQEYNPSDSSRSPTTEKSCVLSLYFTVDMSSVNLSLSYSSQVLSSRGKKTSSQHYPLLAGSFLSDLYQDPIKFYDWL